MPDKTFLRVTNKDIYAELQNMRKELIEIKRQVQYTNGKVMFHRNWLYGVSTFILFILGLIKWS